MSDQTPSVPLHEIQAGIFDPATPTFETHLFCEITDAVRARTFVGGLADAVTTEGGVADAEPTTRLAAGFTGTGLRSIGVGQDVMATFPAEFVTGMASRDSVLGDNGSNAPAAWEYPYATGAVHLWLMIQGDDELAVQRRVDEVVDEAMAAGISTLAREHGQQFGADVAPAKEHFGFNDNIGQPGVEGVGQPVHPGQGTLQSDGSWEPIPVGCFLLGYENGFGHTPPHPAPDWLRTNGTYMVFRKLEQHVTAFRESVAELAGRLGIDEELCAAKFVGRWRSGAPLELCPEADDPSVGQNPETANAFHYRGPDRKGGDADGMRVPQQAHIRRANPRDTFTSASMIDPKNHRIIRRSAPYGSFLPVGSEDDHRPRGLLFRAFNASIRDQFEMIQGQWVNSGNDAQSLSNDRDPFVGSVAPMGRPDRQIEPSFTVPQPDGSCPTAYGLPQFVSVRGGEYFFVPSIAALRGLGDLPAPAPQPALPKVTDFVAEYEAIAEQPGITPTEVRHQQIELVLLAQSDVAALGANLRGSDRTKIFPTPIAVLLSTYDDMAEVFRRGDDFSVRGYDERSADIIGPFMLGMDAGPQYEYESSMMHIVAPSSQLGQVAAWIDEYTAAIIDQVATPGAQFDLVPSVAIRVPFGYLDRFFGVPGPDDQTFITWLRAIGLQIFEFWTPYVPGTPSIPDVAASYGPEIGVYLDELIAERAVALSQNATVPDDVLTRLLRLSQLGATEPPEQAGSFDHAAIRRNLAGFSVGSSVAASTAIVSAVAYLLDADHENALAITVEAARRGDGDLVGACMLEAARLGNPAPPSLFRTATRDVVIAEGTDRETAIPAGSVVALFPKAAMTDPGAIDAPNEFRTDRPRSDYMMFGEGMHTCFGTAVAEMFLRSVGLHLFARDGLRQIGPMQPGTGVPGAFYPNSYLLTTTD